MDGDDFWVDENKLQKQIDFLDQNPDFTVCGHNYWLLYEDGNKVKSYDEKSDNTKYSFVAEDLETLLLKHQCPYMQTSSLVYRNVFAEDLAMKNKFFLPMYAADLIRTLLHAEKGKSKYLNEVMSTYRIATTGVWSHCNEIEQIRQHINFYLYHKKHSFDKKYGKIFNIMIVNYCNEMLIKIKPLKIENLPIWLRVNAIMFTTKLFKKFR